MKKWQKIILILFAVLAVIMILGDLRNPERRIRAFVERNQKELEALAKSYLEDTAGANERFQKEREEARYKGVEIDGMYTGEHPIVQFYHSGFGLVPSSVYYGFYYSPEDVPVPYINESFPLLQEEEDAWNWIGVGDNGGRIERITSCWYYYEAWF